MVIDATKLFCADERPVSPFIPASPFDALFGMKKMKGVFKADLSSILDFKAFPQNISVKAGWPIRSTVLLLRLSSICR